MIWANFTEKLWLGEIFLDCTHNYTDNSLLLWNFLCQIWKKSKGERDAELEFADCGIERIVYRLHDCG